jgi:hypothetical protein
VGQVRWHQEIDQVLLVNERLDREGIVIERDGILEFIQFPAAIIRRSDQHSISPGNPTHCQAPARGVEIGERRAEASCWPGILLGRFMYRR